jgi:SAM-dependent methyltransferase
MRGYESRTYGDRNAEVFDRMIDAVGIPPPDDAVNVLAELARAGRALELGAGTGRIAIPLAAQGVPVAAVEISEAMASRLAAKPGGDAVEMTIGDFADVPVDGPFALIYAVGHTFFSLLTQGSQIECFRNVARKLERDGTFVIEAWVPDPRQLAAGHFTSPIATATDFIVLASKYYDTMNQLLIGHHIEIRDDAVRLYPEVVRYAWPNELDLMAQLAGMRVRERWSDWNRGVFTGRSSLHVTLYELCS